MFWLLIIYSQTAAAQGLKYPVKSVLCIYFIILFIINPSVFHHIFINSSCLQDLLTCGGKFVIFVLFYLSNRLWININVVHKFNLWPRPPLYEQLWPLTSCCWCKEGNMSEFVCVSFLEWKYFHKTINRLSGLRRFIRIYAAFHLPSLLFYD